MISDFQDTGYSLRTKIYHRLKNAILTEFISLVKVNRDETGKRAAFSRTNKGLSDNWNWRDWCRVF